MVRLGLMMALALLCASRAVAQCCGDCDGSGDVLVNELVTAVNVALGGCDATTSKALKPRFVHRDFGVGGCQGNACTIVDHSGAGVLMWMTVARFTETRNATVTIAIDDDAPQTLAIGRDDLQVLQGDGIDLPVVRIPFGALRFNEQLIVTAARGTTAKLTLYYLVE